MANLKILDSIPYSCTWDFCKLLSAAGIVPATTTTSVFLLKNSSVFLLSALEELQAQKLRLHGMREFEQAIVDSSIGRRKLTDPGDWQQQDTSFTLNNSKR